MDVSEITRVLRASDDYGIINAYPYIRHTDQEIRHARDKIARNLRNARHNRLTNSADYELANNKLEIAYQAIRLETNKEKIRMNTINKERPITSEQEKCPVDLQGLRDLRDSARERTMKLNKNGKPTGNTIKALTDELLRLISRETDLDVETCDTAYLDKTWSHSELGNRLLASGHILDSREYARTVDPFNNTGRCVRWAAHTRFGKDADDRASYPTAGLHMIRIGGDMVERYVKHKDTILPKLGATWFPNIEDKEIQTLQLAKTTTVPPNHPPTPTTEINRPTP